MADGYSWVSDFSDCEGSVSSLTRSTCSNSVLCSLLMGCDSDPDCDESYRAEPSASCPEPTPELLLANLIFSLTAESATDSSLWVKL